jgi:phosphate transport system permease protein
MSKGEENLARTGEHTSESARDSDIISETDIARPPTRGEILFDKLFRQLSFAIALFTVLLVAYVIFDIGHVAMPAVSAYGFHFLMSNTWDPNKDVFGVLPAIAGTLYSSILGLVGGTIFGLAIAIFLSERFLAIGLESVLTFLHLEENRYFNRWPDRIENWLRTIIELLAAIPSVVFGLWGIFVVIPIIRPPADWLFTHLGWIPIFGTPLSGPGLLPASIVLAIMVLPTVSAISRDALVAVPPKIREAAFGIGATRWEAILAIFLPTASAGIVGAMILGFGRALGETMALAMLAGNANVLSWSLFSPANTLAALLANHFPEAGNIEVGALMYAALVLLGITLLVNIAGTLILQRAEAELKGLR